jgi:type III restriction enzyme
MVRHLQSYLSDPDEVRNVLDLDRVLIAKNIHAQMMAHFFDEATRVTRWWSAGASRN